MSSYCGSFAELAHKIDRIGCAGFDEITRRIISRMFRLFIIRCARDEAIIRNTDPNSLLREQVTRGESGPRALAALFQVHDLCAAAITICGFDLQQLVRNHATHQLG